MIITTGFVMRQDPKRRSVLLSAARGAADPAQVINHIKAENRYCEEKLAPLADLKETLYQEMISYLKENDDEVRPLPFLVSFPPPLVA
jgi:protease II